jgi:hypothetical protein
MIGTERDTRKRRRKARKERKEENMVALWSEATFLFYDVERISRVTKEGVSVLTNQSRHLTSPSFVPAASSVYHAQCDIRVLVLTCATRSQERTAEESIVP